MDSDLCIPPGDEGNRADDVIVDDVVGDAKLLMLFLKSSSTPGLNHHHIR